MTCSFFRFALGTLLLLVGWASSARSESGYRACIGRYPEQCGLYFNLINLHGTFECGTSVEQVGKFICEAVAKADPSYDGHYKASVISNIPVDRCGYALVYVYCSRK
jgi:hypothetical protein